MPSQSPSRWAELKLEEYLRRYGPSVNIKAYLGGGTDGEVFSTYNRTAIKVFQSLRTYSNERDTYLHLQDYGVTEKLCGFWLPMMHNYDDEIMAVEMDIMQKPPFIIDFGKVRLFSPPRFF